MKDSKNFRPSRPKPHNSSYDWRGAFLRAFLNLIVTPWKFFLSILGIGLGIIKIVLSVVGFITTGLLVAGAIIFKTFWTADINPLHKNIVIHPHSVMVVSVDGNLKANPTTLKMRNFGNKPCGLYPLLHTIHEAKSDDRIEGILLNVCDHDLSIPEIQELRMALEDFRKAKKWVVAYAYDFHETVQEPTNSYYLASCADEIWVHPLGPLSIVGLSAERGFMRGALNKLKVVPHFFKKRSLQIGTRAIHRNRALCLQQRNHSYVTQRGCQSSRTWDCQRSGFIKTSGERYCEQRSLE